MSFDPVEFASKAIRAEKDIVFDSARTIWNNTSSADIFSKPGVAVAETLKEGLFTIPLTNIGKISGWALKGMGKLLWGTVKVGAQLAMLVPLPLPLPSGCNNLAEVGWKLGAVKEALAMKARGNPEEIGVIFKNLYGTIGDVRNAAQGQAIGNLAPAV
ncbi:MAG: hypothetical protein PHZ00_04705 [Candidatus Peribacteraceae bacterium]|nr:hypothetical protein [Candidatus Peribacteraceae bacterium]